VRGLAARFYLFGDTTPASFVVQNAVNGVVKEQTQPAVAQGRVRLQVPPQVVVLLALLLNCRAETVPAQRTTATIVDSNVVFISFLLMLVFLSYSKSKTGPSGPICFSTAAPGIGCDEQNGVPVSIGKMQRQPLAQGLLTPQLPPHVVNPLAPLRNCRAETVPAQRTAETIAVKNMVFILVLMVGLLY
jgi:hypothetical protein